MELICRVYLLILSAYHLVSGVVSMFFPDFAFRFYRGLYGTDPVDRETIRIALKPWGALAAFAGIAGLFAAREPGRYSGVVLGLFLLLAYRVFYRLAFAGELNRLGRIPRARNLISIGKLLLGAGILGTWYLKAVVMPG